MILYQTSARVWLTLAAGSLLLPLRWRLGLWLPLHLALVGAISVAIFGAMQVFAVTLTATPAPSARFVGLQFLLLQVGIVAIAVGVPWPRPGLVAIGGCLLAVGALQQAWIVRDAWRKALNRRHLVPMLAYGCAVAAILVGATFGSLMGSRAVHGAAYLDVRRAHMVVNVLGWAGLAVVGTLVTLLPTVLRVRMPSWGGRTVVVVLVSGLAAMVLGLAAGRPALAAGGGLTYAAGVGGVLFMVLAVLRIRRTYRIPLAGLHMLAAVAWFAGGVIGLDWALLHGPSGFDAYRPVFLTALAGGFLIQILLGAWAYLLPMHRPGHPDLRRRALAVFEGAAPVQVFLLNTGLVLLALHGGGYAGSTAETVGIVLSVMGGGMALLKAWLFPLLGRADLDTARVRDVWGPLAVGEGPP
jgi:nitrite reductase (NO-forming)